MSFRSMGPLRAQRYPMSSGLGAWCQRAENRHLDVAERDGSPRCKAWADGLCIRKLHHKGNHRLQNGFCWNDFVA